MLHSNNTLTMDLQERNGTVRNPETHFALKAAISNVNNISKLYSNWDVLHDVLKKV